MIFTINAKKDEFGSKFHSWLWGLGNPVGADSKNKALLYYLLLNKLPGGAKSLLQTSAGVHRSGDALYNLLHQADVAVKNGRAYGPGLYMAQTKAASDALFSQFGAYAYRMTTSPMAKLKMLFSKGYIDESTANKVLAKAGMGNQSLFTSIGGRTIDDPIIQFFLKKGYIGTKHGDALTSWLV